MTLPGGEPDPFTRVEPEEDLDETRVRPEREAPVDLRERAGQMMASIRARVEEVYAQGRDLAERNPRGAFLLALAVGGIYFLEVRLFIAYIAQARRDRISPNFAERDGEWAGAAREIELTRQANFEETARSIHMPPAGSTWDTPEVIAKIQTGQDAVLRSLQEADAAREAIFASRDWDPEYASPPPPEGDLYDRQAAGRRAQAEADRRRREAKRARGDII